MKSSVQIAPNKHLENYDRMFRKLYKDEELSDVTLCCKDGSIKAHRIILAASSPYFHKIFTENCQRDACPIVILHGVGIRNLKNLIALIYRGNVDVPPEEMLPLYDLAGEFQISGIGGILREDSSERVNNQEDNESGNKHGFIRDTRYKGRKRVAVDFAEPKPVVGKPIKPEEEQTTKPEEPKLSAWARKLRKYKCELCPSSFKRSSHLTRHQLVHTGERPFSCIHCDKAFSRHDKLKNHIRKNHEAEEFECETELDAEPPASPDVPFVISKVCSESTDQDPASGPTPAKRPRGRPRKHPPPLENMQTVRRTRGRPRLHDPKENGEIYDYINLPYGDLNYLTMPLQEAGSVMIEPLVQIETDNKREDSGNTDIKNEIDDEEEKIKLIESKIAKIGECTISIARNTS